MLLTEIPVFLKFLIRIWSLSHTYICHIFKLEVFSYFDVPFDATVCDAVNDLMMLKMN